LPFARESDTFVVGLLLSVARVDSTGMVLAGEDLISEGDANSRAEDEEEEEEEEDAALGATVLSTGSGSVFFSDEADPAPNICVIR
jgi:hypothetical protein